jgi:hypothetical protein
MTNHNRTKYITDKPKLGKKATFAIQCRLQRGNSLLVSFIPEDFAVKGKVVNLFDRRTKKWENGWIVLDTGTRKPYDFLIGAEQDYKAWREVTDI